MRRRRFLVAVLFLTSSIWMSEAYAATVTVTLPISPNSFVPQFVSIQVGDSVKWVNPAGGGFHNVFSDSGTVFGNAIATGPWTYTYQFLNPGIYPYHWQHHGA